MYFWIEQIKALCNKHCWFYKQNQGSGFWTGRLDILANIKYCFVDEIVLTPDRNVFHFALFLLSPITNAVYNVKVKMLFSLVNMSSYFSTSRLRKELGVGTRTKPSVPAKPASNNKSVNMESTAAMSTARVSLHFK